MFVKAGLIGIAFAAVTLPALAADPESMAAEPVAAAASRDWQGAYVGLAVARPDGNNFWAERGQGAASLAGSWSGTLPALSAGYDWQRGNLVLGVNLAAFSDDVIANPASGTVFGCTQCKITVDKLTTLNARVGWVLGQTLVYASAGAASADAVGTALATNLKIGEDSLSGWTGGIGAELYVSNKVTVSASFSKVDLGRLELPTACSTRCYTEVEFGLLQVGVNYRF